MKTVTIPLLIKSILISNMLSCPAKDTIHPWGLSLAYVSMVVKRVDVHLINKSMDSQVTSELFVIFPKEWPIKKGNNWLIPFVIIQWRGKTMKKRGLLMWDLNGSPSVVGRNNYFRAKWTNSRLILKEHLFRLQSETNDNDIFCINRGNYKCSLWLLIAPCGSVVVLIILSSCSPIRGGDFQ